MQLKPITSAPAASSRCAAAGDRQLVARQVVLVYRQRDDRGQRGSLDRLGSEQRFTGVGEGLGDDEVHARFDRPADLLVEHAARRRMRFRIVRVVDAGVAQVAGEQRAGVVCDSFRDVQRLPVDPLEVVLAPDDLHLLAMRVVGERLHDIGSGMHEIAMQHLDEFRMLEHDFRDESASLQIAAPLELEQIAFGAYHGSGVQALHQARTFTNCAGLRPRRGISAIVRLHVCSSSVGQRHSRANRLCDGRCTPRAAALICVPRAL
jgi:hypothetical protein